MKHRSTEFRNLPKGMAFLSPWLVGFCIFTITPIALSFYYSLCDYTLSMPPVFRGLKNYSDILHDSVFWLVLKNTFIYAGMALPAGVFVSLGLALMLNAKIRGQTLYRTIIFLPSLVPMVASAMLWLWIFNGKYGLLNSLLGKVGIDGPEWLGQGWAMPSLAFMSLWGVGYTVVIYLAGLQDVPKDLYEAAEIDGASPWSRLINVTLPMISPVIFFNLIMAIIGTMQVFTLPFIMTGGGPNRQTYFFTMYLYDNAFVYLKMGYANAMAWIQLLIVLSLTGVAFWSSKKWVHYQGK
jgi:multiple sugar transport system permease protein